MEIGSLREAEKTFYQVGVGPSEAKKILAGQVENLAELARFIGAHVASVVLDDRRVLTHRRFVEGLDVRNLKFDPEEMRRRWQACADKEQDGTYPWSFDPFVMDRFRTPRRSGSRPEGEPVAFEERQGALAELMEIGG